MHFAFFLLITFKKDDNTSYLAGCLSGKTNVTKSFNDWHKLILITEKFF